MAIISDPRGRLYSGTVIRNVYYYSKLRITPRGAVFRNVYYSLKGCFFSVFCNLSLTSTIGHAIGRQRVANQKEVTIHLSWIENFERQQLL